MGLTDSFTPSPAVQHAILEKLGSKVSMSGVSQGDFWIRFESSQLFSIVEILRSDSEFRFESFIDLCGVDYLGENPRFEVVVHLYSLEKKHRIRLRYRASDETLSVPSLTSVWDAANWQEREAFDMYGIRFEGHPNLIRILSAPNVVDHPQRKDYPLVGSREVEEDL